MVTIIPETVYYIFFTQYSHLQHSAEPHPPSLLPYSPPPPPMEDLTVLSSGPISLLKEEHLELTGSLGDLSDTTYLIKAPKKSKRKSKEQKVEFVST